MTISKKTLLLTKIIISGTAIGYSLAGILVFPDWYISVGALVLFMGLLIVDVLRYQRILNESND